MEKQSILKNVYNKVMTKRDNQQYHGMLEKEDILPPINLLNGEILKKSDMDEEMQLLQTTLTGFKINAKVMHAYICPLYTNYEIQYPEFTTLKKLKDIQSEIEIALGKKVLDFIIGYGKKQTIGILIQHNKPYTLSLKLLLTTIPDNQKKETLLIPLGTDMYGNVKHLKINELPHLLIAGSTCSGKSVFINTIILTLLLRTTEKEVKLMIIDAKKNDLSIYNGIPNLITPVITNIKIAIIGLEKMVKEAENRIELFQTHKVWTIEAFHKKTTLILPYIVILIDGIQDFMYKYREHFEELLKTLTELGSRVGIHIILSTQKSSYQVITEDLKAHFPAKLSFYVPSIIDSKVILGIDGAEKLFPFGDMLFISKQSRLPMRICGCQVQTKEIEEVVNFIHQNYPKKLDSNFLDIKYQYGGTVEEINQYCDPLFKEVKRFVLQKKKINARILQRKYKISYERAIKLIQHLKEH